MTVEFPDREGLTDRLRAERESLAGWSQRRYADVGCIVRESVGANTLRAFARMPHMLPPSFDPLA